jgi:hypothetical protein
MSLKHTNLTKYCENVQHLLDFILRKSILLHIASRKHKPERFLWTANENFSKIGVTDTVHQFPLIILQQGLFFSGLVYVVQSSDRCTHHFTQVLGIVPL